MRRLIRSFRARVAVAGHSMEPTLRDGDWLLVDPLAYDDRRPRPGELVVTAGKPWLVKRVVGVDSGMLMLRGDHSGHAGESREVDVAEIRGQPWLRYWPPRRIGRVR